MHWVTDNLLTPPVASYCADSMNNIQMSFKNALTLTN